MNLIPGREETRLIEELDRRFQAGIARRAAAADSAGYIPAENWQEIIDSGYLRLFHPKEIGGLGADGVTQARAMESLARACGGTYWAATMSALVCAKLIFTYGDLACHRGLLDSILSGSRLACFAVVERTSGSDAGGYRTAVRRAGNDYVIHGEKSRIANGPTADVAVVLARLQDSSRPNDQAWCLAFVELDQDGVSRYRLPAMGLRAMAWGGMVFNDVRVPQRDVIPVPYAEYTEAVAWGWLFISLSSIAIAESVLSASITHVSERVSFGLPLAHMQGVHAQLADMRVEVDASRLLAWRAAWHRAEGRSAKDLIAMVKVYSTEMAVRATQRAIQLHGSLGLTRGSLVERLHRDAAMNVIGGLASNRLRELVAEDMGLASAPYEPFDWLTAKGLNQDLGVAMSSVDATE